MLEALLQCPSYPRELGRTGGDDLDQKLRRLDESSPDGRRRPDGVRPFRTKGRLKPVFPWSRQEQFRTTSVYRNQLLAQPVAFKQTRQSRECIKCRRRSNRRDLIRTPRVARRSDVDGARTIIMGSLKEECFCACIGEFNGGRYRLAQLDVADGHPQLD